MPTARMEQLQLLLENTPNEPFLLFAVAKEWEKAENNDAALQWYERLKSVDANYVGLYYHMGKLLEKQGREALALEVYEQGILVAKSLNDKHALSELEQVKWELE